jgi:hypothetical protein
MCYEYLVQFMRGCLSIRVNDICMFSSCTSPRDAEVPHWTMFAYDIGCFSMRDVFGVEVARLIESTHAWLWVEDLRLAIINVLKKTYKHLRRFKLDHVRLSGCLGLHIIWATHFGSSPLARCPPSRIRTVYSIDTLHKSPSNQTEMQIGNDDVAADSSTYHTFYMPSSRHLLSRTKCVTPRRDV